MFYSQFILAKKGTLGTIWIAAHLERKLRKNQVADTDIGHSVDSILFPDVPIALRLSSHLLLGVVRIYSRKVNYLFDDCSEALLKVKQAFRSTAVDLPPEESTAPYHSITLPETFDLDDFELPDNETFQGSYVDHHVSSREQITLQDTMEGVVYSTSQFGLDERFGDGDASQIGLEYEIDGLPISTDAGQYDQGPSTPGLQEPNLFDNQGDQVTNEVDHHNSADLVSMKSTQNVSPAHLREKDVTDCSLENSVKHCDVDMHYQDKDCLGLDSAREEREHSESIVAQKEQENVIANDHCLASLPLIISTNEEYLMPIVPESTDEIISASDIPRKVVALHDEVLINDEPVVNDCLELDSNREEQKHLESFGVIKDPENVIANDHCLMTSLPMIVSTNEQYPASLVPEHTDEMISASDIPQKVDDLHDEVLITNGPAVAPLDQTMKCAISGVSLNETVASSPFSHVTSDPENLSRKPLSNLDGSQGRESDGQSEDGHTSSKHEVLNDIKIASMGESSPHAEAQVSNAVCPLGSPGKPRTVDVESQAFQELKETEDLNSHETVNSIESHLRPCTSNLSRPCVSSIEDPAYGDRQTTELSVGKEGRPDLGKSDVQHGSQIIHNQVESIINSAVCDIPEPEKMLSMAHQLCTEPNGLSIGSTPDNQSISGSRTGGAGVNCVTGKKRSFTESTLTVQSVDLAESYGGAQSKRTAEVIPDDDDLLSSILGGRKSSILKLKPSPPASGRASIKRARSAPRTSALKRKVLMDDDMVILSGNTMRLQLTNTEDIRRMRKNAPCTRHEMLMIQMQSQEDEIFHQPILKGLCDNLILMQSKTFDLTGIKVCDSDFGSSSIEETNDKENSRINVTEIRGVERNIEPMSVQLQGDAEVQPTKISVLPENYPSEVNLGSNDIDTHEHSNIISLVKEHDSSQNAEMRNGEGDILVSDAENCSVGHVLELSSLAGTAFENNLCMPNDLVVENHPSVVNQGSNDIDTRDEHTNIISLVKERGSSENAEMDNGRENIEVSDIENCSVGPCLESSSLTATAFKNNLGMPNDLVVSSALMEKTNDLDGSIHTGLSSMPAAQVPILEDEFMKDTCDRSGVDRIEIAEHGVESRTQVQPESSEANNLYASLDFSRKESDEYTTNQASFGGAVPIEGNGNSLLGGLNVDQIFSSDLKCDDEKDTRSGCMYNENIDVDSLHSTALVLDTKETSLNNEDNPVCQEDGNQSTMHSEISATTKSPYMDHNDETFVDANDTGFLNVGDDEVIEDDDDFKTCAEGTQLENSGWSSRTRAVAKYLQASFDKEDLPERKNLQLDCILGGKTQKEASRMFFETLVLKTRDYIHVEQTEPFGSINIKPGMKLMKSHF
ncbi:hypothetical protein RIF29_21767 [Crotalaria pallida]|uniref:Sister chromatid cohesion 1 protein 4-like n=1 Tax=Crotalaria pallida TaxID=3830 RepID=A0AAN9F3I2_CROPI